MSRSSSAIPSDASVPAEVNGSDSHWTYTDTLRSGVYSVALGGPAGGVQRYAVNVDTQESQLERVAPEQLPDGLAHGAADAAPTAARADLMSPSHAFRYVLLVVLLLVLCETFLAWYVGRSAAHASVVR